MSAPMVFRFVWLTPLLALCLGVGAGEARAQSGSPIEQLRRATVTITTYQDEEVLGTGSGFLVSPDGLIVTAAHVIEGASHAVARLLSGEEYDIVGVSFVDQDADFALLRIAGFDLPVVVLGDSRDVEVGQRLIAVGAPIGLEATVSDGLLSARRQESGVTLLQISIPTSPGSSGGPVATEDGRVVALVVSGVTGGGAENLNFALPVNRVRGRIALANNSDLTPLSDLSRSVRVETSRAPRSASIAAESVNTAIETDWSALSGYQAVYEEDEPDGMRWTDTYSYQVITGPEGHALLERSYSTRVHQVETFFGTHDARDFWRDDLRTVIRISDPGISERFLAVVPLHQDYEDLAFNATQSISGSTALVDSAGVSSEMSIPSGVIPGNMLAAFIAGLPEIASGDVHYLTLLFGTLHPYVDRVRIDFLGQTEVSLPLLSGAGACTRNAETEERKFDAIRVSITLGATRTEGWALRGAPHIFSSRDMDKGEFKCVRIPGLSGR